jgi:predicted MPP superfamily phosphohydrolase
MSAKHGTYVCLGDHDYFSDRKAVVESLSKHFISVIDDAIATVPIGSTHLTITGITNVYRNRASTKTIEDIESERSTSALSIFFTHQPSPWLAKIASESDYDLFLAGHTHGGQVVFYLPGLRLAGSRIETPYVTGFHRLGKMLISINNGLGMTLAPIRYQAPPQVTLITVKRGNEGE